MGWQLRSKFRFIFFPLVFNYQKYVTTLFSMLVSNWKYFCNRHENGFNGSHSSCPDSKVPLLITRLYVLTILLSALLNSLGIKPRLAWDLILKKPTTKLPWYLYRVKYDFFKSSSSILSFYLIKNFPSWD